MYAINGCLGGQPKKGFEWVLVYLFICFVLRIQISTPHPKLGNQRSKPLFLPSHRTPERFDVLPNYFWAGVASSKRKTPNLRVISSILKRSHSQLLQMACSLPRSHLWRFQLKSNIRWKHSSILWGAKKKSQASPTKEGLAPSNTKGIILHNPQFPNALGHHGEASSNVNVIQP